MQWKKGSVGFLVIMLIKQLSKAHSEVLMFVALLTLVMRRVIFFSNLNSQLDILRLFHKYCISKVNLTCIYVKITQNSHV